MSGSQPPGWYPAPGSPATERWWDGLRWTGEVREADEQSVTAKFADGPTFPSGMLDQPAGGPGATGPSSITTGGWTISWPGTGPMLTRSPKKPKKRAAAPAPEPEPEATWRAPAVEAWEARTNPGSSRRSRRRDKRQGRDQG